MSVVLGSALAITKYVDYAETISGLTIATTWEHIELVIKANYDDADSAAFVRLRVSNPADAVNDGLQTLNGAAGTKTQGSLTVSQAAGTVAIVLLAVATAIIPAALYRYDLKVIESDTTVHLLAASAPCTVQSIAARATV